MLFDFCILIIFLRIRVWLFLVSNDPVGILGCRLTFWLWFTRGFIRWFLGFTCSFSICTYIVRGDTRDGRKICLTCKRFWIGTSPAGSGGILEFGRIFFVLRGCLLRHRFLYSRGSV